MVSTLLGQHSADVASCPLGQGWDLVHLDHRTLPGPCCCHLDQTGAGLPPWGDPRAGSDPLLAHRPTGELAQAGALVRVQTCPALQGAQQLRQRLLQLQRWRPLLLRWVYAAQ